MSKSREQLNSRLSQIDISERRVLDIGVQNHPTSRLTTGIPRIYHTLDIDPQWHPTFVADLNSETHEWLSGDLHGAEHIYDLIFCIEVLEHCWNPVRAIKNMVALLSSRGDIYISTPFINPHHDVVDYLRFTNEWYRDVLPRYGIVVDEIFERVATRGLELLKQFYAVEGMKISRIRPEYSHYSYPVGYLVHGHKA